LQQFFYYLLANSGLDDAIDVLLPPLRTENLAKYSMYKSYLNGARFYEFSKTYHMYLDIKEKILVVNQLLCYLRKTLWRLNQNSLKNGIIIHLGMIEFNSKFM
jgi:hypothetical protein